jgi:ubiquinone/menaquinone biosynthesis C-methylase UbiE
VSIDIEREVIKDFGNEWERFKQDELTKEQLDYQFNWYFNIIDWEKIPKDAKCFDMGCGSGRWAKKVAKKVGELTCIDASDKALESAKYNLKDLDNCKFYKASFENIPLEDNSMDFGYSLGVLHHIKHTEKGIKECVNKLKTGAPFLIYLYYSLDNKPFWYKLIWKFSNIFRYIISNSPFKLKTFLSDIIATFLYYPLAKFSLFLEGLGINVKNFPLSAYRRTSFYSMRTDSLDRFGTKLEKRFSRGEITKMLLDANLEDIVFSDSHPYWCAVGYKR